LDKFETLSNEDVITLLNNRIERLKQLLEEKFSTKTSTEYFNEKVSMQIAYYKQLLKQYESTYSYFS